MSRYSILPGFAYNTAQQFAVSANHIACIAWRLAAPIVEVDLLNFRVAPDAFVVPRNLELVRHCSRTLIQRVEASASLPAVLVEASLRVAFDLTVAPHSNRQAAPPDQLAGRFVVRLTDERRRVHEGILSTMVLVQC